MPPNSDNGTSLLHLFRCDVGHHDAPLVHLTDRDNGVCEECIDELDYQRCDQYRPGRHYYRQNCDRYSRFGIELTDGTHACRRCSEDLNTCDNCSGVIPRDQTFYTADNEDVCERCAEDYSACAECDDLTRNGRYCEGCAQYQHSDCSCSDCDPRDCEDLINTWSFKPRPNFLGDGPLFLGFELEIDVPYGDMYDHANTAAHALGEIGYLKEDGSISHGFELVTHPMSYEWAMNNFPWDLLPKLAAMGASADNNGLHVHVSRAAFSSPTHAYRWLKLFYRNEISVTTFARRESHWARFTPHNRRAIKTMVKGYPAGERYQAINPWNDDTWELRIFAGSLDPREVKAALALATASIEYTRNLTVADIRNGAWGWNAFKAWVNGRPEYSPLANEMEIQQCAY